MSTTDRHNFIFNGVVTAVVVLCSIVCATSIIAQESGQTGIEPGETLSQPKVRSTQISATVPDTENPTAPILIAPTNARLLTTNKPTFIFTGSEDNVGIDSYQLWLDGAVLFSDISPTTHVTSQYVCTVSDANQLSLLPVSGLLDGVHTWKVIALDGVGLQANSATWQFTIDTQPPTLLITTIDSTVVSISAQDSLTWPSQPLSVTTAQPTIYGTGEANSTGVARLSIPGQSDQLLQFTVSATGFWNVQLPILPISTTVTLTFSLTDTAGNVSIISDLKLTRSSVTVTSSVTPVSTQFPAIVTSGTPYPTPKPGDTLLTPLILPSPLQPVIEPVVGSIVRLATSPRKLLHTIMPASLASSLQKPTIMVLNPLPALWNISGLLWLLLPMCVTLLWLARLLPNALSLAGIKQLLWGSGLWPPVEPKGIVFDSQTSQPIPFATIHTIRTDSAARPYEHYRLCNRWGEYLPEPYPFGTFRHSVVHEAYVFPAVFHPPEHQQATTYYLGEEWSVDHQQSEPVTLIPLIPAESHARNKKRVIPPWLLNCATVSGGSAYLQTIIVLFIALCIPSPVNIITFVALMFLGGIRLIRTLRRHQPAKLFRRTRQPIISAVLLLSDESVRVLARSCQNGQISRYIPHSEYYQCCSIQTVFEVNGQVHIYEGTCSLSDSFVVF